MKTNLDNFYKTNKKEEKEGIWFDISEDVAFRVKRFGGSNSEAVKRAMAKHHKPYARRIENGSLDAKKEDEIMAKVFVESCLVDWKGVEIDGKDTPFDVETAIKFFINLPDLRIELFEFATSAKTYREELGNS